MFKENKGITLVALVVTIIVLLILAAISITAITGENGIVSKAQSAKESTETAKSEEEENLKELEAILNGGTILNENESSIISGDWKFSKDMMDKTTKVNVYIESIYYKPNFSDLFKREFLLLAYKNSYGIEFYDSTDGIDFFMEFLTIEAGASGNDPETVKQEILKGLGVTDEGDWETQLINQMTNINVTEGASIEQQKAEIKTIINTTVANDTPYLYDDAIELYNNLVTEYDNTYGNVEEMPNSIKNATYTIILPDGTECVKTGEYFEKYRIRYSIYENGDYAIAITDNPGCKVKVENIGDCMVEIGDYIYTYNCVPAFPIVSYNQWLQMKADYNYTNDMMMTIRLPFDGWNAYAIDDTKEVYEPILEKINGEKVTAMWGTYAGCENFTGLPEGQLESYRGKEILAQEIYDDLVIKIPENVTHFLGTFANTNIIVSPLLPDIDGSYQCFESVNSLEVLLYSKMEGEFSHYGVSTSNNRKNLSAILVPEGSTMTFDEDDMTEKIRNWTYDENGNVIIPEDIVISFIEE